MHCFKPALTALNRPRIQHLLQSLNRPHFSNPFWFFDPEKESNELLISWLSHRGWTCSLAETERDALVNMVKGDMIHTSPNQSFLHFHNFLSKDASVDFLMCWMSWHGLTFDARDKEPLVHWQEKADMVLAAMRKVGGGQKKTYDTSIKELRECYYALQLTNSLLWKLDTSCLATMSLTKYDAVNRKLQQKAMDVKLTAKERVNLIEQANMNWSEQQKTAITLAMNAISNPLVYSVATKKIELLPVAILHAIKAPPSPEKKRKFNRTRKQVLYLYKMIEDRVKATVDNIKQFYEFLTTNSFLDILDYVASYILILAPYLVTQAGSIFLNLYVQKTKIPDIPKQLLSREVYRATNPDINAFRS